MFDDVDDAIVKAHEQVFACDLMTPPLLPLHVILHQDQKSPPTFQLIITCCCQPSQILRFHDLVLSQPFSYSSITD